MSRRVLLLEPDETARALMARVLSGEGLRIVAGRSLSDVPTDVSFDVAIVDELAGDGGILEEVRRIRQRHPSLPLVVTGALMTVQVLSEVLRLGAKDALAKPFSPAELRDAVARVLVRSAAGHDRAVEFAAAIAEARDAIARGALGLAKAPLGAARAASAFDAEAMALEALVAELEGRDDDADRGYRAALALRREEDTPPPHPVDGLARLALYAGATPVAALPQEFVGMPAFVATDPNDLDGDGARELGELGVVVFFLGIAPAARATYFRASGSRAFVLLASSTGAEAVAAALDKTGVGPLSMAKASTAQLDLERVERLRTPNVAAPKAIGS